MKNLQDLKETVRQVSVYKDTSHIRKRPPP